MRALLVYPERAKLIAAGERLVEPRAWNTTFRGELLIVSGNETGCNARGRSVCIVDLVDCRSITEEEAVQIGKKSYRGLVFVFEKMRPVENRITAAEGGIYEVDENGGFVRHGSPPATRETTPPGEVEAPPEPVPVAAAPLTQEPALEFRGGLFA